MPGRRRRHWLVAAVSVVLASAWWSILVGATPAGRAAPLQPDALDQLVFVTEDIALPPPEGCDGISVFRAGQDAPVALGRQYQSPGRMAATSDLATVFAARTNGIWVGHTPFAHVYALRRDEAAPGGWAATYLYADPPVTYGGAIAVTPDDRWLLVATQRQDNSCPSDWFAVSRFALDEIDWDNHRLGPERGHLRLRAPVAEILPIPGSANAALVTAPFEGLTAKPEVLVLDPERMSAVGRAIAIEPVRRTNLACDAAFAPVRVTRSDIAPDGRYLVTNHWDVGALNVVDLEAGRSWRLTVPGLSEVGGVAFNHAPAHHGRLALHGLRRLGIYEWTDGRSIRELAAVDVPRVVPADEDAWGEPKGPHASIRWRGDGTGLVAASFWAGPEEFISWDLAADGRALTAARRWEACGYRIINAQNDILTGNHQLWRATPTPPPTPPASVTSTAIATATPTATAPVSASPSPTWAPGPTATPTATGTVPPTPEVQEQRVYLPLAAAGSCRPGVRHADVVLVLDASSSMAGPKLAAARDAAVRFARAMSLPADQVAVVAFHHRGWLAQGLTGDLDAVERAVGALSAEQGTRIDLGLAEMLAELAGDRRRSGNVAVAIVLTDGVQQGDLEAPVILAEEARARGVVVHTIGLGPEVDAAYLIRLAGEPGRYHPAPGRDELAAIYLAIAARIPCPGGPESPVPSRGP